MVSEGLLQIDRGRHDTRRLKRERKRNARKSVSKEFLPQHLRHQTTSK